MHRNEEKIVDLKKSLSVGKIGALTFGRIFPEFQRRKGRWRVRAKDDDCYGNGLIIKALRPPWDYADGG